jgi:hypothetical protein
VQRDRAAKNPHATLEAPITVGDLLNSRTLIIASLVPVRFRRAAVPAALARQAS